MPSTLRLFCAVTPGLEALLVEELAELLPGVRARMRRGGVELRVDREGLWALATGSRLAESLRVRIGRFEARHFAALERGLARLPWEAWLPRGSTPEVRVVCHKSILMHTGAVAERVLRALALRWSGGPEGEGRGGAAARLHVRIHHDVVQVSVDASGELLHRRGWRRMVGRAPLRETLAAACLRAARVPPRAPLWDPFAGSGTLPIEHLLRGRPAWQPGRRYAFERWPVHDPAAWDAFVSGLAAGPAHDAPADPAAPARPLAVASDLAAGEIEAARANARAAGVALALVHGDFAGALDAVPQGAAVVSNLPYGHRTDPRGLSQTFARFGRLLRARPDLGPVAVLSGHPDFERAAGGTWRTLRRLDNRGLRVKLLALER